MLINLSNHPSKNWSKQQFDAAIAQFSEVVDIAFPNVPPTASKEEVEDLASEYLHKCLEIDTQATIHVMGEMTFVHAFVSMLPLQGVTFRFTSEWYKNHGGDFKIYTACNMKAVASTSERVSTEKLNDDGSVSKTFTFKFIQFRYY